MSFTTIGNLLNKRIGAGAFSEKVTAALVCEEFDKLLLGEWGEKIRVNAKALYLKILLDQSILEHVKENQKQFADILVIAKTWEQLGKIRQGAARDIEIRILALQEDERRKNQRACCQCVAA